MDKIDELLNRGVANIIPDKNSLKKLLKSEKKLNIYLGIDPTATKIHLGHAVPLRMLQKFSDMGHNVTFLIGNFTALIGDTSDKDTERPVLTKQQIEENFQTYKTQAEKVLDFSKITVKHNSEWLRKVPIEEFIKLCQQFSFGDFASRELIRKRLEAGRHVGLHEALYPVMQGYDSYYMDTDIQIGGTDQTFNMQAGRSLQKDLRQKESYVIAIEFLMGTDGRKMSKSWGNAIWLDDEPKDMYAKIMAINDDVIIPYFTLATNLSMDAVQQMKSDLEKGQHPMHIKHLLATQILLELYGKDVAEDAQENFEKIVQHKEKPEEIPQLRIAKYLMPKATLDEVLLRLNLVVSRSEAKRLAEQKGLKVNDQIIENVHTPFEDLVKDGKALIQIGKLRIHEVILE